MIGYTDEQIYIFTNPMSSPDIVMGDKYIIKVILNLHSYTLDTVKPIVLSLCVVDRKQICITLSYVVINQSSHWNNSWSERLTQHTNLITF